MEKKKVSREKYLIEDFLGDREQRNASLLRAQKKMSN